MTETVAELEVPGARLHVREVGPRGARPLIVVHGGPGEAHDVLRPYLDALAGPHRRIVYWDQRGGGRSPLEPGTHHGGIRVHVADLERVRAHVTSGPVDVLGFSWGALVALLYALEHHDRIARLVLVSPPPLLARGDAAWRALEAAARRPAVRQIVARTAQEAEHDPALARRARFVARVAGALADPAVALRIEPVDVDEAAARAAELSIRNLDLREDAARLRDRPILIVHGQEDPMCATADETAARLGARRVAIARAGHAPFAEAPAAFEAAVSAFLAADPPDEA